MKYGNGSKLLLALLIQGGVIGAAVLYNKFRKEQNQEADDLDSVIEKAEQQDRDNVSQKPAEKADKNGKSITEDLLSEIDNFTNKAKEVVKEIEKPVNILEDFLNAFKIPENSNKGAPEKKTEAPKAATPEKKAESPKADAPKAAAPTPAAAPVKKPEATRSKTVQEMNDELFGKINTYKKPEDSEVVEKNKVNLPKPEIVKQVNEARADKNPSIPNEEAFKQIRQKVSDKQNERLKKAIDDKTVLTSEEVGKKVREGLNKAAAQKKSPNATNPGKKPANTARKPAQAKKAPVKKVNNKPNE